jgi:hypothetical protein
MDEKRTQQVLNVLSAVVVAALVASFATVIIAALGAR